MSVKSAGSINENYGGSVIKTGYLKKLKTYKKKYFVLRAETPESSARLEYYDSERKFNNGLLPKRSIPLKTCFNINRRVDTKYKHVIALYTKDDCFCIVLESEEDLDSWLKALLSLQHGEEVIDGEMPKPTFEHVWQVKVLNRGLGGTCLMGSNSRGQDSAVYRLCLTDKTLSLIKKDQETPQTELCLSSIRSCGSLKNYFYLEVGRSSSTGAGELWMETEDANIAQNVHQTVYHSMTTSSSSKEELGRKRSSSATESSKCITKRPTNTAITKNHLHNVSNAAGAIRERCDSMPSRSRTTSEGNHQIYHWPQQRSHLAPHRPQSFYGRDISYSPPVGSPISPPSGACSTDSAGSSLSIDDTEQLPDIDGISGRYGHSVTPDEAIVEEDCSECPCLIQRTSPSGYVPMAPISSDDGYVDMSPKGRNTRTSPSESMSSITSGTPSTDMRFVEYQLDKVTAYFTPSEEETSSVDRPIRTYSLGSKLEIKKKGIDANSFGDSRVRAFSVGSKSKKTYNRVLPPHGHHVHPKPKSSSAPLLSNSKLHNGDDPMDDLMEMDFSKPNNSSYIVMNAGNKNSNDGYIEMKPGLPEKLLQETSCSTHSENSPYVDMQTGTCSPPKMFHISNDYMPPSRLNNDTKASNDEYVDMNPRKNNVRIEKPAHLQTHDSSSLSLSQQDYMDMNFQSKSKSDLVGSPKGFNTCLNSIHQKDTGLHNCSHKQLECKSSPMNADGYVEMSLGKSKPTHQRQSSLDSAKVSIDQGEYTDMSGSSKKKERRGSKKEKIKSQPISIQAPTTASQYHQYAKSSSSASPVYSSLYIGRKHSTGTPPKMYLPLCSSGSGSYSSLPRQRMKKNNKDSKDSSSSSLTTPSSSSTIFPFSLNSPSSPLKSYSSVKTPETQGNIKVPSAVINIKYNSVSKGAFSQKDSYTLMDFEKYRTNSDSKLHFLESEYVNYNPSQLSSKDKEKHTDDNSSDYAVMKPGVAEISLPNDKKPKDPKLSSPSSLIPQLSSVELSGSSTITESSQSESNSNFTSSSARNEISSKSVDNTKPSGNSDLLATTSGSGKILESNAVMENDKTNDDSISQSESTNLDPAHSSRPSSTSSDAASVSSTLINSRPPSANDEQFRSFDGQLHYATLDLVSASEEEGGCHSPRLVKNHTLGETSCANLIPDVSGFVYAEIDFAKSEGLKHNNITKNAKVKY